MHGVKVRTGDNGTSVRSCAPRDWRNASRGLCVSAWPMMRPARRTDRRRAVSIALEIAAEISFREGSFALGAIDRQRKREAETQRERERERETERVSLIIERIRR